ncbi:MAG: hypothetical protein U0R19_21805 [Bryobacteraceae bacterium]
MCAARRSAGDLLASPAPCAARQPCLEYGSSTMGYEIAGGLPV